MEQRIPKGVRIVVKNGINLEYSLPGSKKSGKSWNWRVVVGGGKKKMATDYVEAKDGCPVWNCEVNIDLTSAADPVVMMVLDGDHRQIGQVVIPLVQIRYTDSNNFDPSRLIQVDLEPTKKNPTPRGRLAFWVWATSFWPPGTKIESKSKSFKGSLSHLGGKLRSKSSRAPSMVSGAYSESNLSGNASYMGATADGGVGGVSPGWHGYGGGITSQYQSTLGVPGNSYNPMAGMEDGHSSDVDDPQVPGRPPIYQSAMNLNDSQAGYAESTSGRSGKHRTLLRKMKSKLSKSTHNLTIAAAKKAGGDKIYGDGRNSVISVSSSKMNLQRPDSSTFGINQIPSGSILSLSRDNYPIEGGTRTSGGDQAYNMTSTGVNGASMLGGVGGGGTGAGGE